MEEPDQSTKWTERAVWMSPHSLSTIIESLLAMQSVMASQLPSHKQGVHEAVVGISEGGIAPEILSLETLIDDLEFYYQKSMNENQEALLFRVPENVLKNATGVGYTLVSSFSDVDDAYHYSSSNESISSKQTRPRQSDDLKSIQSAADSVNEEVVFVTKQSDDLKRIDSMLCKMADEFWDAANFMNLAVGDNLKVLFNPLCEQMRTPYFNMTPSFKHNLMNAVREAEGEVQDAISMTGSSEAFEEVLKFSREIGGCVEQHGKARKL